MEMPLSGPTFDDRYQVILRGRLCGVGDDLGHVEVTLQVMPRGSFEIQCVSLYCYDVKRKENSPCNQVAIECGRYEAVEVSEGAVTN